MHFPWARAPQALPGTSSAGARTFLPPPLARKAAVARPTPGGNDTGIGNGGIAFAAGPRWLTSAPPAGTYPNNTRSASRRTALISSATPLRSMRSRSTLRSIGIIAVRPTRWARTVPGGLRLSVKVPREITHESRLADCEPVLDRFLGEVDGLGKKLPLKSFK